MLYPNAPETLLPKWCEEKMNGNWLVLQKIEIKQSNRAWRIAKQYAHWRISDDYSTLGVNICNKFNPADAVLQVWRTTPTYEMQI